MWAQLAMAAGKSLQDEQNRKRDLASNVITQKYSPWTGARADFSAQGQNKGLDNMMAGYGAGMAQDQADERLQLMKDYFKKPTAAQSDAEYYAQLSKDPSSVGVTSIPGKSSFASVAKAAPAAQAAPQAANPLAGIIPGAQAETPYIFPEAAAQQSPWQIMASQYQPAREQTRLPAQSVWSRR